LKAAMQRYAGVSRDQAGLDKLAQEIADISRETQLQQVPAVTIYNQALVDVLQLESMCEMAMLVAGSAKLRTESRGHHFRRDFPVQDDLQWRQHTCVVQRDAKAVFGTKPIRTR
jgi:succinate dehydrogenase/fumarate reductase flavoprotein subunit